MKKLIAIAIFTLLSAGCHNRMETFTTEVNSYPPGARIEVDDNYLGEAPLQIIWEGYSHNRSFVDPHIVHALPIVPGQTTQTKLFYGAERGVRYGDRVPENIFFDMTLEPASKKYEFELK